MPTQRDGLTDPGKPKKKELCIHVQKEDGFRVSEHRAKAGGLMNQIQSMWWLIGACMSSEYNCLSTAFFPPYDTAL